MATAWIVMVLFVVFCCSLYALTLRYGPRRGHFLQPAAVYRPPGRNLRITLYATAAAHVLVGIVWLVASPGALAVGVLVVALAMAAFYAACAQATAIASLRRERRPPIGD